MPTPAPSPDRNLMDVVSLKKYFPIRGGLLKRPVGAVRAVDEVTFSIKRGETVGLVGESGCGKTTVGRAIMMLTPPTAGYVFWWTPKDVVEKMRALAEKVALAETEKKMTPTVGLEILDLIDALLGQEACEIKLDKKTSLCEAAEKIKRRISPALTSLKHDDANDVLDLAHAGMKEVAKKYCVNFRRKAQLKRMRGKIQFVFQDPFSSLDPKMLIKDIVAEPIKAQMKYSRRDRREAKK